MTLVTQITAFATRVGTEFKTVRTEIATQVAALINDATSGSTTTTFSASKIQSVADAAAAAAASALVNGAGPAVDTLKEISDLMASDESTASALATTVATKVPQTRLVNNKPLSGDITLGVADITGAEDSASIGDTTTNFASAFTSALT